jgi:hypothetical protein
MHGAGHGKFPDIGSRKHSDEGALDSDSTGGLPEGSAGVVSRCVRIDVVVQDVGGTGS